MTATSEITRLVDVVKVMLVSNFEEAVAPLVRAAFDGSVTPVQAETSLWQALTGVGREVLGQLFSALCRARTQQRVEAHGERLEDHILRRDRAGHGQVNTTFGEVVFFWWSYRRERGGRVFRPAAALFPLHRKVQSTRKLVEFSARLGSEMPYRDAQDVLTRLSHGAVKIEDTTIARYSTIVGDAIGRRWTYRTRPEILDMLRARATRDKATGLPLVYASTDAHALTRYVDDTWNAEWKMINGIRVWCVDRETDAVLHMGGEYTWGDCEAVAELFKRLRREGILPNKGDYGEGVKAQLVIITDGARWIEERVLPLFPEAVPILDAYHLIERVSEVAGEVLGAESPARSQAVARFASALGLREREISGPVVRKGHKKRRKGESRPARPTPKVGSVDELFSAMLETFTPKQRRMEDVADLATFLENNEYRLAYGACRKRGIQIGSGAMESMHRFASQVRLKRSGCRWRAEAAMAILRLRLLARVERWDEYWSQPDLEHQLAARLAA